MSLGKRFAASPSHKVVHRPPPGFHFVKPLRSWVIHKGSRFVIKSDWPRTMDFITNEPGRLIHKMHTIAESIFKIDFVTLGDGHTVSHDDHLFSHGDGWQIEASTRRCAALLSTRYLRFCGVGEEDTKQIAWYCYDNRIHGRF